MVSLSDKARRIKRALASTEEDTRQMIGRLSRRWTDPTRPPELFETRALEFRPYHAPSRTNDPALFPTRIVSPDDGHYMHSFFDVPPTSPSGRYLLLSRIPFIWRLPLPGDAADLCLIDLQEHTIQTIHRSFGWGMQLGINAQWHPTSDDIVFCNDLIDGEGRSVMIDLRERRRHILGGPLYTVGHDGRYLYGPSLTRINHSQDGYGVPLASRNVLSIDPGPSNVDGIWRTDTHNGQCECLITTEDLTRFVSDRERLGSAVTTLFHCKIAPLPLSPNSMDIKANPNQQSARLFQVVRHLGFADNPGKVRSRLLTLDIEGRDIRERVSVEQWDQGGHHPNWTDHETITMNLAPAPNTAIEFVDINDRTGQIRRLVPNVPGSGHPTQRHQHIITDCYHHEGFAQSGGLPIRMIHIQSGRETAIQYVECGKPGMKARRVDPHPVWSRNNRQLIINCTIGGQRQTLMTDMSAISPSTTTISDTPALSQENAC